jgi:PIN domain nuclease of toxin-antitoxin system
VKLLLDTHIWLWYLLGNEQLSSTLQSAIAEEANELWLSPISIWETLILAEKGKLSLKPNPISWLKNSLQFLETKEAPLSHDIAILSRQIQLEHQDPADRFLAATAIHFQLTLVTVDTRLTQASWLNTLS